MCVTLKPLLLKTLNRQVSMPIFSADYASDPAVRRRVMSALWALMTPAVAYLYVQVDRVYRGGGGGGGGGGGWEKGSDD